MRRLPMWKCIICLIFACAMICTTICHVRAESGIEYEFAFAVHTISGEQYIRHVGPDASHDTLGDDEYYALYLTIHNNSGRPLSYTKAVILIDNSPHYFNANTIRDGSARSFLLGHKTTSQISAGKHVCTLELDGKQVYTCTFDMPGDQKKHALNSRDRAADEAVPPAEAATEQPSVNVGDVIAFGTYEQDNDVENGPEPIEWIVLDYDETGRRALLLSRYGLDVKQYHESWTNVTWEKCTLRTWLNNDFFSSAFSTDERSMILLTEVDNSDEQGYEDWDTAGGNDTRDSVFLLSYREAHRYLGVSHEADAVNMRSNVELTEYAIAQGASMSRYFQTYENTAVGQWWLRSPGYLKQIYAAYVDPAGSLANCNVNYSKNVIRPAFWMKLTTNREPSGTPGPIEPVADQEAQDIRSESDTSDIRALVGRDLYRAFAELDLPIAVDIHTGTITLQSSYLFSPAASILTEDGQQLLTAVFSVFHKVLSKPEYSDRLKEIAIEGHTDDLGSSQANAALSQSRAEAVRLLFLTKLEEDREMKAKWEKIMSAHGYGGADPVYQTNGAVIAEASRRIVIKPVFQHEESSVTKEPAASGRSSERLVNDPDAYFSQRGTLIRKIPAAGSNRIHTEREVIDQMDARGFSRYSVTAGYDLDGTVYSETPVSDGSDSKHPIYTTYYVARNGDIWILNDVNGTVTANPVSYNLDPELDVQVIIAETDTIMSYDSHSGLFYETIPDPARLIVKKVDRIDAETLEKLNKAEVGKL